MNVTPDVVAREAAATGFDAEPLEKALRLVALLEALFSHPFLKPRLALKGGTALNLFLFDVPRLSVDIDLNYIGAPDRDTMLRERPQLEQAIQAVCSREALAVARMPADHAGGKWRLTYTTSHGVPGHLELDVNFMLRTPLWPCARAECRSIGSIRGAHACVLDVHELAAGKLAALLARSASRDIFDSRDLLATGVLDPAKLRVAFVVYGGMNRKDWRTVSIDDVKADVNEVQTSLVPMLRADLSPERRDVSSWRDRLVHECRERLAVVLPMTGDELEFLRRLNAEGEIAPELLTADPNLRAIIGAHPMLQWKAINVRQRRGVRSPADG
jgi:predicted nucleotidyltransferase component of viral defense system